MIPHIHPSITDSLGFGYNVTKALKKIFPVRGVFKDRFALDSTDNDVMQCTGGIYAGFTRDDL